MTTFSLEHLDAVKFEQFCYDLLCELGFVNVDWRKGTGLSSSPSDRGRDIECELEKTEIDGSKYVEKWFIECKHYKRGVPPEKLQSIITWAEAENPDTVLIIASEFLSNPAKDYIKNYKDNKKPRFKIKFWERLDIERMISGRTRLLRKYDISGKFPVLSILHPSHVLYMRGMSFNTLDYLFNVLDKLDSKKRDSIFGWTYDLIVRPRATYKKYKVAGVEFDLRDEVFDEVSYESFKKKCYGIAKFNVIEESLFVYAIIDWTLRVILGVSDTSSVNERITLMRETIEYNNRILADRPEDREMREFMKENGIDVLDRAFFERSTQMCQEGIQKLEKDVKENYELYVYFCENVLTSLMEEKFLLS